MDAGVIGNEGRVAAGNETPPRMWVSGWEVAAANLRWQSWSLCVQRSWGFEGGKGMDWKLHREQG